jgi:transcriptional regulator GlxA family with amidase domain
VSRVASDGVEVLLVAVRETAGSALYGLLDVLGAAGTLWQTLLGEAPGRGVFRVRIVAPAASPFRCGHAIPVHPHVGIDADPHADLVIIPELWLAPDESLRGRYPELTDWLRRRHAAGSTLCSACSGAMLLAETGLLDGCEATSHWAYGRLFERDYPEVRFRPAPNLVFADRRGTILTAGGTTSWHDLALYLIARHAGPGEALRIAKIYLMKWHAEGQLPYTPLVRRTLHADGVVRRCEQWLAEHYVQHDAIRTTVAMSGLPERTFKRRFRMATGCAPIVYLQNLRVEAARRLLESDEQPVEAVGAAVGYEDASFFRRLFRRTTGVSPGEYRRMFQPLMENAAHAVKRGGDCAA